MKKLLYGLAAADLMRKIASDLKRRGWDRFVGEFTEFADTAKEGTLHNSYDLQELANVIVTQVIDMFAERHLYVVPAHELSKAIKAGVNITPLGGFLPHDCL